MQCFDEFVDKPSQLRLQRRLWFSAQFARKSIFQKLKGKKCLLFIAIWENEWMNSKPMMLMLMLFWIRAKKATRKRVMASTYVENMCHTWNRSNPIQPNRTELNWIMFIDIAVNRSNLLLLYISLSHTHRIYNVQIPTSDIYHRILIVFLLFSIEIFCSKNCYLALHLCIAKVPKMVGRKAFWAHDRNSRREWRWRWNDPIMNLSAHCAVCSKRNANVAGIYET